jgi:hypothetical protein
MKNSRFIISLCFLIVALVIIVFAPYIGLGAKEEFVLWRWFHLSRGNALSYPAVLAFLLCVYQVIVVDVGDSKPRVGISSKINEAWKDGKKIVQEYFGSEGAPTNKDEVRIALAVLLVCAVVFGVLVNKDLGLFTNGIDQHWHQGLVEYDVAWRTPIFELAGNVLHQLGIQLPLNTQLLPFSGVAQLFPRPIQIGVTVALTFLGMVALFWVVGLSFGLRLVPRAAFSGLTALVTTLPAGLDVIFWLLPPNFFTSQFTLALWWQEAPILALGTIVAFYWIGNSSSVAKDAVAGALFTLGCFAAVLSYPVGGVYFIPIIVFYCGGLLITSSGRREIIAKMSVGGAVVVVMLLLRVPLFFRNLYEYAFGSYFYEALKMSTAGLLRVNFMVTLHGVDFRGLIVFTLSFAALFVAAVKGAGGLRRFALAALICEGGIVVIGTINAFIFRAAIGFGYAEIAHSPMWGSYFVLTCMVLMSLIDRRLAEIAYEAFGAAASPKIRMLIDRRHLLAVLILLFGIMAYAATPNSQQNGFEYPPARPKVVRVIESEIRLVPGTRYKGTSFTLLNRDEKDGVPPSAASYKYRSSLGNDLIIDLPADGIPSIYEHAHWTSPMLFAFLRSFFGRPEDSFDKAYYILRNYDPKIARLMGIRVVVTDSETFADGKLIHEEKAGAAPVRIYRIDDINLGQYSPTQPHRVASAAEAIAALKRPDFDPKRDVVVEGDPPSGLVSAQEASIVTDYGPTLTVRATSVGRSLVVLPFEYSHCLHIEASPDAQAKLVPVNLQQIGLIFDKEVEARITYRFGLGKDAACRGEDIARADRLRLREIVSWPH